MFTVFAFILQPWENTERITVPSFSVNISGEGQLIVGILRYLFISSFMSIINKCLLSIYHIPALRTECLLSIIDKRTGVILALTSLGFVRKGTFLVRVSESGAILSYIPCRENHDY